MVFENIFLLKIPSFWAILLISFVLTLVTTLVYKFTTDQKKMKKLKEEMKEYQKKIKALSKESPEKMMAMQQQALKGNTEYMKHSFRSTLYTIIPLLLIFSWLSSHLAYEPIMPGQPFKVSAYFSEGHVPSASIQSIPELEIIGGSTQQINESVIEGWFLFKTRYEKATWTLKGEEGEYKLTIDYNNEQHDKPLTISSERRYENPEKSVTDSKLKKIVIENQKIYPVGTIPVLGWAPSWLWTYILLSLLFSIGIRKILKVY
jgi:uncharacterized membrane protein (DUF106 family)